LKVPGDYFYNISNIMIRLSTQNCISYAELCDTYGFYEQADFYEKLVNTKVAANNGLGISNQSWIKNDDIAEKAIGNAIQMPFNYLQKSNLSKGTKGAIESSAFAGMDLLDVAGSAADMREHLGKMKTFADIAKKSPQADKAQSFLSKIATKIPGLARFVKFLPLLGIIINLYQSRKDIAKYIDLIAAGKFDQIWNDAEERAKFIEVCLLAIAGVLVSIPLPITKGIGGAFYATASLSSLGRQGIDSYLRYTGEKDDIKSQIADTDFSLSSNIEQLIASADPDVKNAIKDFQPIIQKNPFTSNRDILNNPVLVKKYRWLANPMSSENQLKYMQFMQFVGTLKKEILKTKPKTKTTSPTSLSNKPNNNLTGNLSNQPSQQIIKPTDVKYYVGYGYSLYKRTKDLDKSLSELKHKLQADKIPVTDQNSILTKFKEIF
jgi:hypothetical protein